MVGVSPIWREVREGIWHLAKPQNGRISLETEGWKNGTWHHGLAIVEHLDPVHPDTCILEITGDDAGSRDDLVSAEIGRVGRLPVATLFNVPNQPIFDLREDALLAFSFMQSLATGDSSWPALVPMVKSVLAAMSALTELSNGKWTKFVITGASKRGWTSWLTAATADPRIVAIAPRMFDNLRSLDQMRKQVADWEGYSPMLQDYTSLGLQDIATTGGPAAELAAWLDPATFLSDIRIPVLILNGANDPFWCVDSSSVYQPDLPPAGSICCSPDTGHVGYLPTFAHGAFAALCDGSAWPTVRPSWDGRSWQVSPDSECFGCRLWTAHAADRRFQTAHWFVSEGSLEPRQGQDCYTATFLEYLMPAVGAVGPYSLTSHVQVVPPVS